MSVEAITWALKQDVGHSSAKFVLVVLSNSANADTGCSFVSTAYVSDATGQDRKTVIANMRRLQDMGYISDTGKRVGKTGQVIVYRINTEFNGAESGTFKESQKRNSTENGTVPKTDSNSTDFPVEQSRFSREESQKRDTETVLTVTSKQKSNRKERASASTIQVVLPDWLPADCWNDWVEHRKSIRKAMTQRAAELSIGQLDELRSKGFTPKQVIENAIVCGWQGLYAPKTDRQPTNGTAGPANRQKQLEERNRKVADAWVNGSPASRTPL